ncbi:MAG: endo alpha-1,4 polygalactosaminidase [Chloroflexota bacterium]|nr:endo alpha-1,4 polygalactosaminidase [Chloroflexota bacterium]
MSRKRTLLLLLTSLLFVSLACSVIGGDGDEAVVEEAAPATESPVESDVEDEDAAAPIEDEAEAEDESVAEDDAEEAGQLGEDDVPPPTPEATATAVDSPSWWQPAPGTSWQWQINGAEIDTSVDVDMYDIDLYEVPQATIDQLHADGRIVICYFSAGSWEEWRPDADQFPPDLIGDPLEDWEGENWLDTRQLDALAPIMAARLDLAARKGCDGVEPDNVDGYDNETGFPLTYQDQITYNIWLSEQAHQRGLSIGLKNDLAQIPDLLPYFDWALSEECFYYDECEPLTAFVQAQKAVFGVEYELMIDEFCPQTNAMNFDFLKKNWELDAWREACR